MARMIGKWRLKKSIIAVAALAVALYFVPFLALFFIFSGTIDVLRNEQKESRLFKRYFLGNGYATWFLSPLNLLIDLFCYKNKRIYTLEDFQEESRKEIEGIISVFDTRKEEIIAQVDNAFESGRRGMLVYRWFGKQQNKTIDEFNKPLKYIQTIAISVFDGKESTSFHFGPLRLTLRLLYNLTPVESDDIFIECGHTKHYWHKNPLFIFDDTLMHRSVNNNDARRYCVFMDVIRPSPVTVFLSVLLVPISMIAQPIKGAFYKNWKMLGANRETQGATTKS